MGESDCAYLCANQVLEILRLGGRRRLDSRELVEKKIANSSYNTFHELYYDIRVSSLPLSKPVSAPGCAASGIAIRISFSGCCWWCAWCLSF